MKRNIAFTRAILLCSCFFVGQMGIELHAGNVTLLELLFSKSNTENAIIVHKKHLSLPLIYNGYSLPGENELNWEYGLLSGISYWTSKYETSFFPGVNSIGSTCHFVWDDCQFPEKDSLKSCFNYGYAKILFLPGWEPNWKVRIEKIWTGYNSCEVNDCTENQDNRKDIFVPYKIILFLDLSEDYLSNSLPFTLHKKHGKKPDTKFKMHRLKRSGKIDTGTLNWLTVFVSLSDGQKYQALIDMSDLFKSFSQMDSCCRIEITVKDSGISTLRKGYFDKTGKNPSELDITNH